MSRVARCLRRPPPLRQRGGALFIAVFLVAVVSVLAAAVSLTSVTQSLASARGLQAEQAWYAALARIESEVPGILSTASCPAGGPVAIAGFTTTLSCSAVTGIEEGGRTYSVFTLEATASTGNAGGASLVRRTARAQFTSATGP
jgi:hypothetical protein